jgi:predicted SprT family Zn-dependent metalloprotease
MNSNFKIWKEEDIRLELLKFSKIANLNYKKWDIDSIPIRISKKMTRSLGAFKFSRKLKDNKMTFAPVEFVFSDRLLNGTCKEDTVRNIIGHEFAHFYCTVVDQQNNGHNEKFKMVCCNLGVSSKFWGSYSVIEELSNYDKKEYHILCTNCNKLVAVAQRKSRVDNLIKNSISACCRAKLKYRDGYISTRLK